MTDLLYAAGFTRASQRGAAAKWVLRLLVMAGGLNLIAFAALAIHFGGNALAGDHVGSRYFLALFGHSTEVSRGVFLYSLLHTLVTLFASIAALAASLMLRLMDESRFRASFS